jgi:endonuclease III
MSAEQKNKVSAVMSYYSVLRKGNEHGDFRWSDVRKRFTLDKANAFFLGVMLNQGQLAERAWNGAEHFVENHFTGRRGFWNEILGAHPQTVKSICTSGYEGKSYASVYCTNKFPRWLRSAARKMLATYQGDPRNIWAVAPKNVSLIYDRFREFDGIGDALAKMAQFILVRNFGVAGGKKNQSKMAVKPDRLVRRVPARTGITKSVALPHVLTSLNELRLSRPADFDASLWVVGREFCSKTNPNCSKCPLQRVCEYVQAQQGAPPDRFAYASLRRNGV